MDQKTADILGIIGICGMILAIILWFPFNLMIIVVTCALGAWGGLYGSKVFGSITGILCILQAFISPVTNTAIGALLMPGSDRPVSSTATQVVNQMTANLSTAESIGSMVLMGIGTLVLALSLWGPMAQTAQPAMIPPATDQQGD